MTKAERLMYLVNLIRSRAGVEIGDMAAECGVSQRTIYRDLNTLFRVRIPIYYENGYRLRSESNTPALDFSSEDLHLIRFALQNNPLSQRGYLAERFKRIEQKLTSKTTPAVNTDISGLLLYPAAPRTAGAGDSVVLACFLEAAANRRRVRLRVDNGSERWTTCMPLAVRLSDAEPFLVVLDHPHEDRREFALSEVSDVRPTNSHLDCDN